MDRLGDLICTLPVDQHPEIQKKFDHVQWLIAKGLEPVMECSQPKRKFWSIELKFSFLHFYKLIQKLKTESFEQVVLFYAPWWVAMACWVSRIPLRYSPRSRWFQLLFFNHTLKQKRSLSAKHEAKYNWDLLHWSITGEFSTNLETPFLELKSDSPLPSILPPKFIVIHPGMGGSALNWPAPFYLILIQKLLARGNNIVITGTASDREWLTLLEKPLQSLPGVFWLVGQLDLKTLISVLAHSTATIAPSTGVLHLAASTGTKTIGIYSPIRVQTPRRWGPRGLSTIALTPTVNCPATTFCLESKCKQYPCLEQITPDQIIAEIFKETGL